MFFCVSQKSALPRVPGMNDFRSAPAVKALSPAPVTMAIHTSGLSRTSIHAFDSSA